MRNSRSILPSLPEPNNEPLVVEILKSKITSKKHKIAEDIAKITKKILLQFSYKKLWTIGLKQQITNKSDFVFKFVGRHKNAIICRFKPGDNSTCWDIYLNPPKGYLIDEIISNLKQVPLDAEFIRLPQAREAKIMAQGIGKSAVPSAVPRIPLSVPASPPIPFPVRQTVDEPDDEDLIQEINSMDDSMESMESMESMDFRYVSSSPRPLAIPLSVQILGEDLQTLDHGLVALTFGIANTPEGHVLRSFAGQILIQELGLIEFVSKSEKYSDPSKAAAAIIKGLCNRGFVNRWYHPIRKDLQRLKKATEPTTKGFTLSPSGRQRIELLKNNLPLELKKKLFRPDLLVIDKLWHKSERCVAPVTQSTYKTDDTQTMIDLVKSLIVVREQRKQSIKEFDSLIDSYRKQQVSLNSEKEVATRRLETIKIEFQKLEAQMIQLQSDIVAAETLKSEEEIALECLRMHIEDTLSG